MGVVYKAQDIKLDRFVAPNFFPIRSPKIPYYDGRMDEAETVLDRANDLSHDSADDVARVLGAFVYAARNERAKIDKRVFAFRPEQIMDGDVAYWTGGIYALLGDKAHALEFLRRTVVLGDVDYPGSKKTRTTTACSPIRSIRRSWQTCASAGKRTRANFDPGT